MWDNSNIPVPAHGKDKNQTAARRPHAGGTSIRDAIVMLKWRLHVASQWIMFFLEVFFMFFSNIKCGTVLSGEQEKEYIIRARMG